MTWPDQYAWMSEHPNVKLEKNGPTRLRCDCRIDVLMRQYRWCDEHGPDGIARTHDGYMDWEFEMRRIRILEERAERAKAKRQESP